MCSRFLLLLLRIYFLLSQHRLVQILLLFLRFRVEGSLLLNYLDQGLRLLRLMRLLEQFRPSPYTLLVLALIVILIYILELFEEVIDVRLLITLGGAIILLGNLAHTLLTRLII